MDWNYAHDVKASSRPGTCGPAARLGFYRDKEYVTSIDVNVLARVAGPGSGGRMVSTAARQRLIPRLRNTVIRSTQGRMAPLFRRLPYLPPAMTFDALPVVYKPEYGGPGERLPDIPGT